MTTKSEIAQRNKLHLLRDDPVHVSDALYGYDAALTAAGVKVIDSQEFGSYQGDWWAQVQFPNDEIYYVTGSYGSCSHCDAFQAEFGYRDDETPDYPHRLRAFGRDYLENCYTLEEAIAEASKNLEWDTEAEEMVKWLQAKATTSLSDAP
jgi:hypothetical protein